MREFHLSIDIVEHCLHRHVTHARLAPERRATIERIALYDPGKELLQRSCLYLCFGSEVPPVQRIQPGAALLLCDGAQAPAEYDDAPVSYLVIEGLGRIEAVNTLLALMGHYQQLWIALTALTPRADDYGALTSTGSDLLGLPVCLLDLNQDVVARSDSGLSFFNPLWETVVKDSKPKRCELLDQYATLVPDGAGERTRSLSEAAAQDPDTLRKHIEDAAGDARIARSGGLAADPNISIATVSIAGYLMLRATLHVRGHLAGSLWAFQTSFGEGFDQGQQELFTWIASCALRWMTELGAPAIGSGSVQERFLIDALAGVFDSERYVEQAADSVGWNRERGSETLLAVLRPKRPLRTARRYRENAQALRELAPHALCALFDGDIVIATPTNLERLATPKLPNKLHAFCAANGFFGIISSPFKRLTDAPSVLHALTDCFSFLRDDRPCGMVYYADFVVPQTMLLIARYQPLELVVHPFIRRLAAYDVEHGTEYLITLKAFLNNRASVAEASKQLHVHRNTLQYRIARIEELLGCTFEDWEFRRTLLYSIDFLIFMHNQGAPFTP